MTDTGGRHLSEVHVATLAIEPLYALLDGEEIADLNYHVEQARRLLAGRTVWNVNSTAAGGGVAEMLPSLLAYSHGAGVDARWLVIGGNEAFFRATKRLHNYLHGDPGDGQPLAGADRQAYQAVTDRNAVELAELVRRDDVVILHDPQTAGLIHAMQRLGAVVVWRSHVGAETVNEYVARGWDFLRPFVSAADAYVFSRHAYVPPELRGDRAEVIPPSIDPLSPKNQDLSLEMVRTILRHVGLMVNGKSMTGVPAFRRFDGSTGQVKHRCDVQSTGPPPDFDTPIVTQVSRWDRLKDPLGVMQGFAEHVAGQSDAHLILAGPTVHSVTDDPEGQQVLDEVEQAWRKLPHFVRSRVHLACLPMSDVEENAAIVNALQRQAAVVVQKSLQEGFGLTITEAMWKARPVVASAVGGVLDQIEDGTSGFLLSDPRDLAAFGRLVLSALTDQDEAERLGRQARERVRRHFLVTRHLSQYVRLLERLIR